MRFPRLLAVLEVVALLAGCAAAPPGDAHPPDALDPKSEIAPFVQELSGRYGYDAAELERLLADARVLPNVLELISRPAEAKPWYQYRPIFLTEKRINAGTAFWTRHEDTLAKAESTYGVPASVIVAIIGVETFYGERAGRTRVLDALATLGFRYPRRAAFFRRELESFVVLCRDERLDARALRGSYAGAMGIPQFIPSSYREYAVDFDGDGVRDLLGSEVDAIGSVASYLARHGWRRGEPIATLATVTGDRHPEVVDRGLKPATPLAEMRRLGIVTDEAPGIPERGALVRLENEAGPEFWVGFANFYAITRYNHSPLYAMAVTQLAAAMGERRATSGG